MVLLHPVPPTNFYDAFTSIFFIVLFSILHPSYPHLSIIIICFYFVEEEKRLLYNTLTQKGKKRFILYYASIEKKQ